MMSRLSVVVLLVTVLCSFSFGYVNAKLREGDCEVCVKVVNRIASRIGSDKSTDAINALIKDECEKTNGREHRFCYYIGGIEIAATGMLLEVSRPLQNGLPAERICERIKAKDSAICELRYEKPIDLADVSKLRVRDLKKVLSQWGEACNGCLEKEDFVLRVNELKHKHQEL